MSANQGSDPNAPQNPYPEQPGQYPPQPGQYPPDAQYPTSPGQYPPEGGNPAPGAYPEQPGQYPPSYPGPGPVGTPPPYQSAPPKSRRGEFIRLGILLVIVAVIVGGFILFRDRISNEVTSLAPGECFDQPAAGDDEITDVQRHPCNEAHDAEVFMLVRDPAAADAIYPILNDHFIELARDQCLPAIGTYVGQPLDQRPDLDFGIFFPTSASWGSGDRGVTCYLYKADASKLTAPLRAGPEASTSSS